MSEWNETRPERTRIPEMTHTRIILQLSAGLSIKRCTIFVPMIDKCHATVYCKDSRYLQCVLSTKLIVSHLFWVCSFRYYP
jgi:hypothetical protein